MTLVHVKRDPKESFERMLSRFKKLLQRSHKIQDAKEKQFHKKKPTKRYQRQYAIVSDKYRKARAKKRLYQFELSPKQNQQVRLQNPSAKSFQTQSEGSFYVQLPTKAWGFPKTLSQMVNSPKKKGQTNSLLNQPKRILQP